MATPAEIETRHRIRLSLAAHAYERHSTSFISDGEYDERSRQIDLSISTGNLKLDTFFKTHFVPDTGMWVHKHPEREKLEAIFQRYLKGQCT